MAKLSSTAQAVLLFLYVLLSSALIIGIVRHISSTFHTFQIVTFYNIFGFLCFLPWMLKHQFKGLKPVNWKMLWVRAVLEFVSFSFSFYALTLIPLPTHTALLFVTPIFGVLVAMVLLREKPTPSTMVCIFAGFGGVLIITRPGFEAVNIGILFALFAAMGFAFCGNVIKILTRTDSSFHIAFYMLLMSSLISLPFGIYHFVLPTPEQWAWLAAIGVLGFSQQLAVGAAFARAPYTTIVPLNFAQLVFVSIVAYLAYGELVDWWTIMGSAIIIVGTLYNAYASTRKPTLAVADI